MRIRIVDAFTDRPFAGNPAGVLVLPDASSFPDQTWLQQVAAELNLSETAFAHRLIGDAEADWALRWFTPGVEVDLCGHATLASAHVLYRTGMATGTIRFRTRGGILTTTATADAIAMDFPAAPTREVSTPTGLIETLGVTPVSVRDTGALGDLLVELSDEQTVRTLRPNFASLTRLGGRGVIVTAAAERRDSGYDFVSRMFAPAVGIPEDPVTGSAHTALAPFWSARLGRAELTGVQVSRRGGVVGTELRGDRVRLTGHAVLVVDGELVVDSANAKEVSGT